MSQDAELLRRYAVEHSEAAFTELIRRHVDLVYSAALRLVNGDAHRAQDVTQQVFAEFARQVKRLMRHPAPVGWLYTTTRLAALRTIRTEQRRSAREQEATTMNELLRESTREPDWDHLRPVLEDAMHELGEKDRRAVLLRFFQNKSLKEVGMALGLGENAARMRVERALEKLRAAFLRQGVAATATLASVISANAVHLAPANLAATLTTASVAAAGTGTTFTLLKIMTTTQLKLGLGALVVAGAATAMVIQHQAQIKLRIENESLQQQITQLKTDDESLSNQLVAASSSQLLPDNQLDELLRLRSEVGLLRRQTNELGKLREALAEAKQNLQPPEAKTAVEQQKESAILKMTDAKQLVLGMVMYADDNQQQYPTNFEQIAGDFKDNFLSAMTNQFEIVYQGPLANITSPSSTIVVQENQAWQTYDGKWAKTYGFADGHSEVHVEPDGSFNSFEQQHRVSPPPHQYGSGYFAVNACTR
jgi:RNA polymerase sigma factor (sigma-70 family)